MVNVGQELLTLLDKEGYSPDFDWLKISQKVIEFSAHFSNLAGFCDSRMRNWASRVSTIMAQSIISKDSLIMRRLILRFAIGMAVGFQVDFTKKPPFRAVGLDVKAFGAQIKGFAKR